MQVASASLAPVTLSSKLSRPAPARLVAVGDLHGDLEATRRVLRLAGAIDAKDKWIGGAMTVVQTGDEIDRGDDDKEILDLVERLKREAKAAGGEFIALCGNHELMNVAQDFRYVTPHGFEEFAAKDPGKVLAEGPRGGRAAAFKPGSEIARELAERPIVVRVGDTVFVHGGLLPRHLAYGLDKLNDEVDAWLVGASPSMPAAASAEDSPVWSRVYSTSPTPADCAQLQATLTALGAKRLVMGHTVQEKGINSVCEGAAWRIDVGMSKHYGGAPAALEIRGDAVKVLQ